MPNNINKKKTNTDDVSTTTTTTTTKKSKQMPQLHHDTISDPTNRLPIGLNSKRSKYSRKLICVQLLRKL